MSESVRPDRARFMAAMQSPNAPGVDFATMDLSDFVLDYIRQSGLQPEVICQRGGGQAQIICAQVVLGSGDWDIQIFVGERARLAAVVSNRTTQTVYPITSFDHLPRPVISASWIDSLADTSVR